MRASSFPRPMQPADRHNLPNPPAHMHGSPASLVFNPFSSQAFSEAHARRVPVFLIITDAVFSLPQDDSLFAQLRERTVPIVLSSGERPDVELLCQRAGLLFSQEGALPLCALLLDDTRPFLAASLPPDGFPLDPLRLYAWLSHADRRFSQNAPAMTAQADQVIRSFKSPPLKKPYSPQDAAHDLSRALQAIRDTVNEGFGQVNRCPCKR